MKKIFVAGIAAAALCGASAIAADMPVKAPAVAPIFNWTGLYVGAEIGYGFDPTKGTLATAAGALATPYKTDPRGLLGGGRVGYNWQSPGSVWVWGIEADIDAADLTDQTPSFALAGVGSSFTVRSKISSLGSVRGRLGYAMDHWLLYATGGWAYGHTVHTYSQTNIGGATFLNLGFQQSGWTVGGGVEYALSNHWSVTAEYRHIDLGNKNWANAPNNLSDNFAVTTSVVLFGANYKFGPN